MKTSVVHYSRYLLLFGIILLPLFGKLETVPIRVWDEARQAINAYEMSKNHNFLVTYFEGQPDMWNTKPPFLIWLQVVFMKVFGVSVLAVRLPSAIAAFLTCVLLLFFSERYLKSFWFGFIAVLLLVCAQGYVHYHATRTGDYDALLTLFTTAGNLFFFLHCESKKTKYLYLFFAATALGVLTKSVSGLLFLPALAIYAFYSKQFLPLIRNKHFYVGLTGCLLAVLGYYGLREVYNPGYLEAVYQNELGGRYLTAIEGHTGGFWFYYDDLINYRFPEFYLFIPCGVVIGLASKERPFRKMAAFSFLVTLTFFLIISTGKTKLPWYDVPLFPFYALLSAITLYCFFTILKKSTLITSLFQWNPLPFLLLFLLFINPYKRMKDKVMNPVEASSDVELYEMGYYLKDAVKGKHPTQDRFFVFEGYNPHNNFYIHMLKERGVTTGLKEWNSLAEGDKITTYQKTIQQHIEENYHTTRMEEAGNIVTYEIQQRKH
ncbi:ArnT family glycosyltransferase [Rufibacter ruber]|uniref:ArnT family glycosyltransferase n=1 Tax=Rufibacter ruber TaxID=1783499 RepID=UPI000942BF18|nr:glycosyltransferase family 39 protein [Rufibacter ruber]